MKKSAPPQPRDKNSLSAAIRKGAVTAVSNMRDLFTKPFGPKANVIYKRRKLSGDFNAVAAHLQERFPGRNLDLREEDFAVLASDLKGEARKAAKAILRDYKAMRESGCSNVHLRLIRDVGYNEDDGTSEGVHLFHSDGGCKERGRVLTCYNVAATEGIAEGESMQLRHAEDFDLHAKELYRQQGEKFAWSQDRFLDYAYAHRYEIFLPLEDKQPFSFRLGDIWRQAVEYNKAKVEPFIHKAPRVEEGAPARLLMVGDYYSS